MARVRLFSLWAPLVFWCTLIFVFSHIPSLDSGLGFDYPLRKAAHLFEYAVLWLFCRRAFDGSWPKFAPQRTWPAALLFCLLYAVSDEWHQTFIANRVGCWQDVALDFSGACLACFGRWIFRRRD